MIISQFFKKSRIDRLNIIKNNTLLKNNDIHILKKNNGGLNFTIANKMIENVIGTFSLPLGIATNFIVNDKKYLVPMVIEESSVIAAASRSAKIASLKNGFHAEANDSYSIGQIHLTNCKKKNIIKLVHSNKKQILNIANSKSTTLSKLNKGAKDISCRKIDSSIIIELLIDVGDAMGANITNTMCEAVSPFLEKLTGGTSLLKILSNYSTKRLVKASAIFDKKLLGEKAINKIILAYKAALHDEYRAVTHNKGIMNGIIAVSNATCQDTRAIEAAAHAFASSTGKYLPLTKWKKNNDGDLLGIIELPLSVGIVGGITNIHPIAKLCLKIMEVKSSQNLACIIASVGLAQNFGALYALVTDGIQKGHMKLHAKNIAMAAGIRDNDIDLIVQKMIKENNITLTRAKQLSKTKIND